jgi:hypothetical protein
MNPANMLHQMCHSLLAATDVKALCKARGLAPEAAKSPGILETLFLSSQGVSEVLCSLDPSEVAMLHLLKNANAPVDVSLFAGAYGQKECSYGTFNQRYQDTFAKIKQRLIRGGLLLWSEGRKQEYVQDSKLERTRFAFPVQFHAHLPPLITSPREFDGSGNWKPNVARDKLIADLGRTRKKVDSQTFQVEAGELQLNGKRFQAAQLFQWQQSGWKQAVLTKNNHGVIDENRKRPEEAALCILSELADGFWADVEQLAEAFRIFCGKKVDAAVICEAGWDLGLLAKRKAAGKTWYRPMPQQPHVAPHRYLTSHMQGGCVSVDLTAIPLHSLEQVVEISDQRLSPAGGHSLLLTPNFVKLGRADDKLLASEVVQWLLEHTPPFAEARVTFDERRGKTILHEGVTIARVSDLSLKVSIEKTLGSNVVSLKNDFIAFPRGLLADVERVVKKSGHVVKEVAAK